MKHLNKTDVVDLLEELGVETEPLENSKIDAPKTALEIIMERQDRFGERMDPNYRTIKEQDENKEEEEEEAESLVIRVIELSNKIEVIKEWFGECTNYEYAVGVEEAESLLNRLQ